MRTNGNTENQYQALVRTQVDSVPIDGIWTVQCDDNYIVEYKGQAIVFASIDIAVTGWEGYISTIETDVEDDLAALEARVTVNEGDIDTAEVDIGTLEGEMDDAEDRLTVNEGNIAALSVQASRVLNVYDEAATPDEWRVINGRWVRT